MAEVKGLPTPSKSVMDEVVELRRHFHRHPEVSFSEQETSVTISERLRELGLEVQPCPTETGAVAMLDTGRPGKTVMLRADIDALPIHEESGVDFSSGTDGRMHACGLLEQQRPEVVVGLHIVSFMESGTVVTRPGLLWAGSDAFDVKFSGPGGHGGMMGRRGNVLAAQAFFIERLYTVVEGLEQDGVQCHSTVGNISSDGAWNVVPRGVLVQGSLRTFNGDLRVLALDRLHDLLKETES